MIKNIYKNLFVIGCITLFMSCSKENHNIVDDRPDSIVDNDPQDAPSRFLEETWNGHDEKLYRFFYDSNVAVYYSKEVDGEIEWPYDFTSSVWENVKTIYNGINDDDILYIVLHTDDVNAFSANKFNQSTNNKYLIDLTLQSDEINGTETDAILKQISQLVETSAFGVNGSPASAIWKEMWSEIFTYDVYLNTGMEAEAERFYNKSKDSSAEYPNSGRENFWFRDWFYPIYENYGESVVLNNFYRSIFNNFYRNGNSYARDLNFGEFVHFFSGAAGEDIQPLAETAFGWTDEWQTELYQARADFPDVNYPFEPTSEIKDFTVDANVMVSNEHPDGPDSEFGSSKLIDNDIYSKFWIKEYNPDLWLQQELPEAKIIDRYTMTSGNDVPFRDPKSWVLMCSNDRENWVELDRREGIMWNRSETKEFVINNNETAYKYYRLNIYENNGGGWFQLSEWRLLRLQLIDNS